MASIMLVSSVPLNVTNEFQPVSQLDACRGYRGGGLLALIAPGGKPWPMPRNRAQDHERQSALDENV
jgi:hypothetical protein